MRARVDDAQGSCERSEDTVDSIECSFVALSAWFTRVQEAMIAIAVLTGLNVS
jgi:hypothetical protein